MRMIAAAVKALRPKEWSKNVVFLPPALVFSQNYGDPHYVGRTIAAIALFCALSSTGYLFNDLRDVEADRHHPTKRHRPIASGALPVPVALGMMLALPVTALVLAWMLAPAFFLCAASYLALTLSYTLVFKHMVLLDVMFISAGFLLRAVAGAAAIEVPISPWFLVCTSFLALFLGFSKRLSEIRLLEGGAGKHRKNLKEYSPELLTQIITIVTACTVISYAMYTFESGRTPWLMLTLPFVIYGIFRYMYLVERHQDGGAPAETLLRDRPLQVNIALFVVTAVAALQFGEPKVDDVAGGEGATPSGVEGAGTAGSR